MDFLTDLAPLIISIGVGAIPVVGGIASTAILATLRDRNMNTMWFEVVSRAGGLAYQHLVQSGRPLDKPALTSAAAVGASYILERLPGTVKARNLDTHDLINVAQAELGKLLAQDPTIGPEPPLTIPTENTSHG
jgi:hypothetical protein